MDFYTDFSDWAGKSFVFNYRVAKFWLFRCSLFKSKAKITEHVCEKYIVKQYLTMILYLIMIGQQCNYQLL